MTTLADRITAAANVCMSGGAEGADVQWGIAAKHVGHAVVHFSFSDHRQLAAGADEADVLQLDDVQLAEADPALRVANIALQRTYPPKSRNTRRLLQRDWYQIRLSQAVYAVSSFDKNGQIEGGTAWAVQMFIDRHGGAACKAYLFDQEVCRWYVWAGWWKPIYEPPTPTGVWTGIGRRKLNQIGGLAINVTLGYQPPVKTIWG